jgi:hypothetical protein
MRGISIVVVLLVVGWVVGCSSKEAAPEKREESEPVPVPAPAPAIDAPQVAMVKSANREELAKVQQALDGAKLGDFVGKVELAEPQDATALTKDDIHRVIKGRAGLLRACYAKELERKPDLSGKVLVRFTISAEGKVSKAAIDAARSTLDDPAVTRCVVRQFLGLRFPAKGGAQVNYPLIFSGQQ